MQISRDKQRRQDIRMMKRLDTELMRNRRIKLLFDRVTIVIIMEWSGITKINLDEMELNMAILL